MRVALAITSWERPDALAAVLASVMRQSQAPDEIIIADDGSGAPTRHVIDAFVRGAGGRAHLVSQPHDGFRVARLRNLAVAKASADYVVFIDGDMLLHREFLADHVRCARRGYWTQGVRARADERLTASLVCQPAGFPAATARGLGVLRRAYLLYSPSWSRLCRRLANGLIATKACNQGFWREDLVRLNGFNEDIVGWGPEDKELCARAGHAGIRRQTLLFGGITCHLHHPAAARDRLPANLAILEATRRERRVRCEHGLDSHTGS